MQYFIWFSCKGTKFRATFCTQTLFFVTTWLLEGRNINGFFMIIAFIYINFDGTSKNAKKSLALFFLPKNAMRSQKMPNLRFLALKMPGWQPCSLLFFSLLSRHRTNRSIRPRWPTFCSPKGRSATDWVAKNRRRAFACGLSPFPPSPRLRGGLADSHNCLPFSRRPACCGRREATYYLAFCDISLQQLHLMLREMRALLLRGGLWLSCRTPFIQTLYFRKYVDDRVDSFRVNLFSPYCTQLLSKQR